MPLETGRMQRFVAALLEQGGALVEPLDDDALEVMAAHSDAKQPGIPMEAGR